MGTTVTDVGHKLFTVSEANALIPWLAAVFTEVKADVDELLSRRSWEGVSKAEPGMMHVGESDGRILELEERIQGLLHEVSVLGIEIRRVDGMVDFPSCRNGELIYLCWRLGEPKVLHWHAMYSGWPERKRLDASEVDDMGLFEPELTFRGSEAGL